MISGEPPCGDLRQGAKQAEPALQERPTVFQDRDVTAFYATVDHAGTAVRQAGSTCEELVTNERIKRVWFRPGEWLKEQGCNGCDKRGVWQISLVR